MQKGWNDYYQNEKPINDQFFSDLKFNSDNDTLSLNEGNSYILNCYFYDMQNPKDGGAIACEKQGNDLLVEKCSFYRTSARSQGAIRVFGGNSIFVFLCGQSCFSNGNDGFCSVYNDETRTINFVFDSSVSHCEAYNNFIMYHYAGHVYIKSVNLSHNKADSFSALTCEPTQINEKTKHGSNVLYSSFSNNTAKSKYCIRMNNEYNSSCTHEIKNCNIILNEGRNTIRGDGQTDVISCCVMNNTKIPVFSGSIKLYNCSVSSDQFKLSFVNTNSVGTTTFIHGLTFISTGFCQANFDVIGSLIPTQIPCVNNCFKHTNIYFFFALRVQKYLLKCIFLLYFLPSC